MLHGDVLLSDSLSCFRPPGLGRPSGPPDGERLAELRPDVHSPGSCAYEAYGGVGQTDLRAHWKFAMRKRADVGDRGGLPRQSSPVFMAGPDGSGDALVVLGDGLAANAGL